jgi:hypothetical protein
MTTTVRNRILTDGQRKNLAERSKTFRRWRAWHREQLDSALRGPWHAELRELLDFRLTSGNGKALVDLVKRQGWHGAGSQMKYLVLRELDQKIIRLREDSGLDPFSDPLPWSDEPDNVFRTIKQFLLED